MKKKGIIIAIVVAIIAILIGVGVYYYIVTNNVNNNTGETQEEPQQEDNLMDYNNTENVKIENETKINNSTELSKEKTFFGLKLTNIKLVGQDGMTTFTADVQNTSGKDYEGKSVTIVLKNQDGTEYSRLPGFMPSVKNGEATKIEASTTDDITNAYDFTIEENVEENISAQ